MLTGQTQGPSQVHETLDEGGLGEVYRASDTRLDSQRRHQGPRARHPHICGIHDVGEVDGTHYLVMPLLEGEMLAARLARTPVPLDAALKTAADIADALDKAHTQSRPGHRISAYRGSDNATNSGE